MSPTPLASVVDCATLRSALPAARNRPSRRDIHDEARGAEVEVSDNEILDGEQDSEYGCGAQGGAWVEDFDTRSLVSSPCASTSPRLNPQEALRIQVFLHHQRHAASTKSAGEVRQASLEKENE